MQRTIACCIAFLFVFSVCGEAQKESSAKFDKRVAVIINRMTKGGETEQKAFSELEALGCAAVPAIVAQMDDRRELPDKRMSLVNKFPNAFEGKRHYGPEKVVDALDAILNQLTGQSFGFLGNGASDAERTKAVEGWREFIRATPPEKLCVGG